MKVKNLQSLEAAFKAAKGPSALLLLEDETLQRQWVDQLVPKSTPCTFIAHEQFSLAKWREELSQLSLFSPKKAIVVFDIHLRVKKELDEFAAYLEKPVTGITLLLFASGSVNHVKLKNLIEKEGVLLDLLSEKPWEKKQRLAEHIDQLFALQGVSIDLASKERLLESVGDEVAFLDQEVEKLITYVGRRKKVSLVDVELCVTSSWQTTIWPFLDAILASNTVLAMKLGCNMMEHQESLFLLLANLRTQFRTLLEMHTLYEEGGAEALVQRFAYLKGTLLEKKINSLKGYGLARLAHALVLIYETEVLAKESWLDEELLFEILIIKLC